MPGPVGDRGAPAERAADGRRHVQLLASRPLLQTPAAEDEV